MSDRYKKLLYLTGFAVMMSSLYVLAEAKSLESQASRKSWPANDPEMAYRVTHADDDSHAVILTNAE